MGTIMKTDSDNYNDIADAIREKSSSSDTYLPSEMGNAIRAIPQEGGGVSMEVIAPEYDNTKTYAYGQIASYNNKVYYCDDDIEVPEEFDPNKWVETSLGQELNFVKGDVEWNRDKIYEVDGKFQNYLQKEQPAANNSLRIISTAPETPGTVSASYFYFTNDFKYSNSKNTGEFSYSPFTITTSSSYNNAEGDTSLSVTRPHLNSDTGRYDDTTYEKEVLHQSRFGTVSLSVDNATVTGDIVFNNGTSLISTIGDVESLLSNI